MISAFRCDAILSIMKKNRAHDDLWIFLVQLHLIKQILNPCEKGLTVTRHDLIKEQKQKTAGME